jgi:hypothetical protein
MTAFTSITPCSVVDLSSWRAKVSRDDDMVSNTLTLTREAWREMKIDYEAKVVLWRMAVIEADRALDVEKAREAEDNAQYYEATLRAIRGIEL